MFFYRLLCLRHLIGEIAFFVTKLAVNPNLGQSRDEYFREI
jgi:hypothetical protein